MTTHSAKGTKQHKEQWGLEAGGSGEGRGDGQHLKKGG